MTLTVGIDQPPTGGTITPGPVQVQAYATDDAGPPRYALLDHRDEAVGVWVTDMPGRRALSSA